MTILGSIGRSLGGNLTSVTKAVPVSSLPTPKVPTTPLKATIPSKATPGAVLGDPPNVKTEATKTTDPKAGGSGTAILGAGMVGMSILPTLLNSSVIQSAVSGATELGTASIVGNQIAGVANNLVDNVTSNPLNLFIVAGAVAGTLYLIY